MTALGHFQNRTPAGTPIATSPKLEPAYPSSRTPAVRSPQTPNVHRGSLPRPSPGHSTLSRAKRLLKAAAPMAGVSPTASFSADGLEPWFAYLAKLGAGSTVEPRNPPRRVLLGLPTTSLAGAVISASGIVALGRLRSHSPLNSPSSDDVGKRVSAFTGGCYVDVPLVAADGTTARVNDTTLERYTDVIRRLPDGFPDRGRRKLQEPVIEAWQDAAPPGIDGARLHARVSATPIVVLGHRSALTADLEMLEEVWPQISRLVDVGTSFDDWFRHPLIVLDPNASVPAWGQSVTASLVVCDGAAAWRSPIRRALGSATHLLALDRRSPAAVDLADLVSDSNPETDLVVPFPPAGVEVWSLIERLDESADASDDEDLF
jgi:hypothetical protein